MNKLAILVAVLVGFALGTLYEHMRMAALWELSSGIRDVYVKFLEGSLEGREASRE